MKKSACVFLYVLHTEYQKQVTTGRPTALGFKDEVIIGFMLELGKGVG